MAMEKLSLKELIRSALKSARMEKGDCCFGTDAQTDLIRQQTRLYRETWIIPQLEEALARLEKRSKKPVPAGVDTEPLAGAMDQESVSLHVEVAERDEAHEQN